MQVVSGLVGSGVAGVPSGTAARVDATETVLTASAGTHKGLLLDVTELIAAPRVLPLGAVGNKVLALLKGDADVGLMHLKTSLWDTCATEAVLRAAGGVLTDLHGCPIEHSPGSPTLNRLGVLASTAALPATGPHYRTHDELCAALRASGCLLPLTAGDGLVSREAEEIPQATDVARTISGQPITAKLLSQWVRNRNRSDS